MGAPLIRTAEIRWFLGAPLSTDAVAWFDTRTDGAPPETRTDRYLVLPSRGAVGAKLRPGVGFELKVRTGGPDPWVLGGAIEGYRESWAKWTCSDPTLVTALAASGARDPLWVEVRKSRRLCRLSVANGVVRPWGWDPDGSGGGHVELTAVDAGDRQDCTLGIEAWGSETALEGTLAAVGEWLVGSEPPPFALDLHNSYSYPGWLESSGDPE